MTHKIASTAQMAHGTIVRAGQNATGTALGVTSTGGEVGGLATVLNAGA